MMRPPSIPLTWPSYWNILSFIVGSILLFHTLWFSWPWLLLTRVADGELVVTSSGSYF